MSKITLKKVTGKSKRTGKDFSAYELRAGHYSTLIFPRSLIESDYLDKFLQEEAHDEFTDGGYNVEDGFAGEL